MSDDMTVSVTAQITHRCPYVDEYDHGTVQIVWNGHAPELHDVRHKIEAYADQKLTHEEVTQELADVLGVGVVTTWNTAGMGVVVSAVPLRRDERP